MGNDVVSNEYRVPSSKLFREAGRPRIECNDPLRLIPRALTKLYSLWISLAYPFMHLGSKCSVHYTCDLRKTGLMAIGDFVTVHKDAWIHVNASGTHGYTGPILKIGDNCFIGRRAHISAKNRIYIEDDVILAANVLIVDHGHEFGDVSLPIREQGESEGGKIHVGRGCWIGQGAAIICESGELVLGANCVVGANAVVTRSAPAFSVLSGNPARIVKQFDPVKKAWALGSSRLATSEGTSRHG